MRGKREMLQLHSYNVRMKLRIGLLLNFPNAPAWVVRLVERLQALDDVELVIFQGENSFQSSSLLSFYFALEKRLLSGIRLPAALDVRGACPHVQVLSVKELQTASLDLFISTQPDVQIPSPPRLGVWMWNDVSPFAGIREALRREPLTVCELSALLPNGQRKLLRRAVFATDPTSAARNQNRVFLKAASTLLWALKKLAMQGEAGFFESLEEAQPPAKPNPIRPMETAALAIQLMMRGAAKKIRQPETWMVFADSTNELIPANLDSRVALAAPRGMYWADPFAFEKDGKIFLFVEEYVRAERKGRIACLTLNENAQVISHHTALERPYHLSYPFVFEHKGEIYMLPETSSRRAVELYRCVEFPNRWEFARELMRDVYAVDSTLLHHNGRWWLFANLKTDEGASSWDELHLFFADDPLTDDWTSHPLNPIVSDARAARPAGKFFCKDGVLYRPSQDCSLHYGYALNLNRVDVLSESDYRETHLYKWIPQAGFSALHTYNRASGWIFTDGATRAKELK